MPRNFILTVLLAIAPAWGCGSTSSLPTTPHIRVAAASDLQTALPAVIERFRATHDIEVEPVFGSSGQLAKQIGQGGPFDLFLSANRAFVDDLASKGTIEPGSVQPYTRGALVLVVNRKSGVDVRSLADLAKPEVKKIAIANPAFAPYGVAASQAIEWSRLADSVASRIVTADSVRHALQFVQTGNAEAGLVAHSVAGVPEVESIAIDPALYDPIDQYQGIVARSSGSGDPRRTSSTAAFADFLRGEEGQAILKTFGFAKVEESGQKTPAAGASK
jgi:molybdate transport system substrate-binding protein